VRKRPFDKKSKKLSASRVVDGSVSRVMQYKLRCWRRGIGKESGGGGGGLSVHLPRERGSQPESAAPLWRRTSKENLTPSAPI